MIYELTIYDIDKLNEFFQVFTDLSTITDEIYTYNLISKITDCDFKITGYFYSSKSRNIKFKQLTEVNSLCKDCEFDNNEFVVIEFETEEDALYFKLKYCS